MVSEEHIDTDDDTIQFQIITKFQPLWNIVCGHWGRCIKGKNTIFDIFTAKRKQTGLRKIAKWGQRKEITYLPPIKKVLLC